jgi:hypothetical protein
LNGIKLFGAPVSSNGALKLTWSAHRLAQVASIINDWSLELQLGNIATLQVLEVICLSKIIPRFEAIWENVHYIFVTSDCLVQVSDSQHLVAPREFTRHV